MSGKAPSAGTKVTTGENIPTTREAPGKVAEESLAAESARKGGAFAANPGQEQAPQKRQPQPQASQQHQQQQGSRSGTEEGGTAANKTTSLNLENQQTARGGGGGGSSSKGAAATEDLSLENQQAYGGPAPSYVLNQRHRDPAGPHGKNLTEGGFEGSGTEEGPLPEPGSIQDPARVAARDLRAGMAGRGGDAGRPRQTEGVEGKSWYTPLGGDEPA